MSENDGSTTATGEKPTRFGRVSPTSEQVNAINSLRPHFETVEKAMAHLVAPGRYHSLALTKLEEANFYCNKAITHEGIK